MKRISLLLVGLLLVTGIKAQVTAYVCDGYDYESVTIASRTDMTFSTNQDSVTLGDETFCVADVDSILFHEPQYPAVTVTYSGTTATVNIPSSISGVTASVSGAHVTLTSTNTTDELLYVLSGTSSDGSLTINGSYKMRIHLNGVSLTSTQGAALDIECGKRIEMKLLKGTENTFVDCANGSQKGCIYTKGHLELKGKGTLNVTGNTKHAICAKEYLQLKPSTGTVNVLGAVADGFHCGKGSSLKSDYEDCRFVMDGGTVSIKGCGSDCVDADDFGSILINGGALSLDISQTDGAGLKADSILYMNGGSLVLNVTGDISQAIRYNYCGYFDGGTIEGTVSAAGAKALKAKKATGSTTVNNGGDAYFRGTDVTLSLSGGTYTADQSKCMGLRVDRNFYQTGGSLVITSSNTEAVGVDIKGTTTHTGGTCTVNGSSIY